jgi:hypothetical protein
VTSIVAQDLDANHDADDGAGGHDAAASPAWPAAPTLSPFALPKARALTDALTAGGAVPSAAAVAGVRAELQDGLSQAAEGVSGAGPCLRIRAFDLVRADTSVRADAATVARDGAGSIAPSDTPFRWTARTARRRVGLAAVRWCLAEPGLAPVDAVARVVADPTGPSGAGACGPGSCADWLASLSSPARTAVQADATTWATTVWSAIEWDRLPPAAVVGGPDRWWDWRGPARVALQGRADIRVPGPHGAHLIVLDGFPSPAARRALGFTALVDGLRSAGADLPARVVAWWPACGKAWIASVDEPSLRDCARQVVRVVHGYLHRPSPDNRPVRPVGAGGAAR